MGFKKIPSVIRVGVAAEQYSRRPGIDISEMLEMLPDATPQLFVVRPGEREAKPATVTLEGTTLYWEVNNYDTRWDGCGTAQVVLTKSGDNTSILESQIIRTAICKTSLSDEKDAPDPYETWTTQLLDAADRIESTASEVAANAEAALEAKDVAESSAEAAKGSEDKAKEYADAAKEAADTSVAQVDLVKAEGEKQIGLVSDEGTRQIGLVTDKGAEEIELVAAAGSAQRRMLDTVGANYAEAASGAADAAIAAKLVAETAALNSETAKEKSEEAKAKAEDAQLKAEEAQAKADEAKGKAETAAENAKASADAAAGSAAAAAQTLASVNAAGEAQIEAIQAEGSAQVTAVRTEGASQVGEVKKEGSTQVTAVADKGAEVLASIPQDYTQTLQDISDLKSAVKTHESEIGFLMALHLDGTAVTYKRLMKEFFAGADDMTPVELTQRCCEWYDAVRDNWDGWTEFYQPDVSAVSTGTRGGDNADMVCKPSTDTVAGRDDFAGLPLFAPTDVNWEIDATTLDIVITGVDGITSSFERDNPDKLVGVMQMTGFHWRDELEETFVEGYSAQYQDGHDYCQPVPEGVRVDGTMRPFVVHAKYMGKVIDNKMRCFAGVIPSTWQSHNTVQTRSKANGSQYGGGSVLLQSWLTLMTRIKYASLTLDGIIQGCLNYNYQYQSKVEETGVKRFLLTPAEAANLVVGCGVLLGHVASNNGVDRSAASVYDISKNVGAVVTAIEDVEIDGTVYSAVYVDTPDEFDTVGTGARTAGNTVLSTFMWPSGTNGYVLGNDGSIGDCTSGKFPAKLQGIEFLVGAYEVFGDIILQLNPTPEDGTMNFYKVFIADRSANQATSITGNYRDIGVKLDKPSGAGWTYIKHVGFGDGVYMAEDIVGGSASTFAKDGFYRNGDATAITLREWPAFGHLDNGSALGGLSCVRGHCALSGAYWYFAGRPSSCANRGVWGVSPQ